MKIYLALFCLFNLMIPVWGSRQGDVKQPLQSSQELIVKTALKQFVLTYDQNRVAVKGYQVDLSLDRKECNAHIIDRFNNKITQIISDAFEKKKIIDTVQEKGIDTLEIQIGGKTYFTKISSPIGRTFLYFPQEVLRMKWEEKFNCE